MATGRQGKLQALVMDEQTGFTRAFSAPNAPLDKTVDLAGTIGPLLVEADTGTGVAAAGTTIQVHDEEGLTYIPAGFAFPNEVTPTAVLILLGEAATWFSWSGTGSHGHQNLLSNKRPKKLVVHIDAAGAGVVTSLRVYTIRERPGDQLP